jgi:hypothetical protein
MIANIRRFTGLILVVAISVSTGAASEAGKPAGGDMVTTFVKRVENGTTRTVAIRPLHPARFLREQSGHLPGMNASVVLLLLDYPRDGSHEYWWPRKGEGSYDGCTTNVLLGDNVMMQGEPGGRTYCCGLTLEAFYRVLGKDRRISDAVTSGTARDIKKLWYCRQKWSPGPEDAMLFLGVGKRIADPDKALPGDFVQIWRNDGSGHSVIFVRWARDFAGRRVGMHYWSTQEKTRGIGFNVEPIATSGRTIDLTRTSITRLLPPAKRSLVKSAAYREKSLTGNLVP